MVSILAADDKLDAGTIQISSKDPNFFVMMFNMVVHVMNTKSKRD